MCITFGLAGHPLRAQTVMLAPQLTLYVPTGDFLRESSGFRTRFGVTAGFQAAVLVRPTRHLGFILRGFWATPNSNATVPGSNGYLARNSARVSGLGVQIAGYLPLRPGSTLLLACGPTLFRQRIWDRPRPETWNHSSSWGLSTSLQLQHRLTSKVAWLAGVTHQTYHSDIEPLAGDSQDASRQQHEFVVSTGFGFAL